MSACFASYQPLYDLERIVNEVLLEAHRNANPIRTGVQVNTDVRTLKPRMDLHKDTEKNLVTATFDFPGVSKEDLNVEVRNGKLTISAEIKQSDELNENGYGIRERRYGKYSRTLQLPQGVKDEEIKASLENGVLTVVFPQSTPEIAPKRIDIS